MKIDPDNRDLRVALGLLYYDMNKFDLAAAEFSAILQQNTADDKVRYLLATTYEEKGDNKLALEEYRDIASSSELYVHAQIRAGIILKKRRPDHGSHHFH